jgi:hypothetical protein
MGEIRDLMQALGYGGVTAATALYLAMTLHRVVTQRNGSRPKTLTDVVRILERHGADEAGWHQEQMHATQRQTEAVHELRVDMARLMGRSDQ